MFNVETLGQVFTPQHIVSEMLMLRRNNGRILEPSCGNGAFYNNIPNCVGIDFAKIRRGGMANFWRTRL